MGAAREKTQADFDLERFIDMFDEALTSKDERVVNALRSLMMMVILTKPETRNHDGDVGPLRQLHDDLHNLNRRIHSIEDTISKIDYRTRPAQEERFYNAKDFWGKQDIVSMTDEQYKLAMFNVNSPIPKLKP
jgi:hypothetical protein